MFGWLRKKLKVVRDQAVDFADQPRTFIEVLAQRRDIDDLSRRLDTMQREQRTVLRRLMMPPAELWRGMPARVEGGPSASAFPCSTLCRQESFETGYFFHWADKLGIGVNFHRKTWEFVFVLQSLYERGALVPGARALGFGVGAETLPAYLASIGCVVVGTDIGAVEAVEAGWMATGQHASGKEALRRPSICPDPLFDANVAFQTCDMNAISADLRDFDFCWSACAFEHLGSIENGLQFVLNSVDCLKPGGWAIHTTEYNLDSNTDTLDNIGTVLFRRQDFEDLARRLADKGCQLAPFDFNPGYAPIDRYIDVPPYLGEPHLKLALEGYATTSAGLIIHKIA